MPDGKENMQLWVAALRSGKYQQGFGALKRSSDKLCCEGVACLVAKEHGAQVEITYSAIDGWCFNDSYGRMPTTVEEWLGVGSRTDVLLPQPIQTAPRRDEVGCDIIPFVMMNDAWKFTFDQIADVISWYYGLDS
jgi:hypothetical protein